MQLSHEYDILLKLLSNSIFKTNFTFDGAKNRNNPRIRLCEIGDCFLYIRICVFR